MSVYGEVGQAGVGVGPARLPRRYPEPAAALALFKPITWFAPMWAFGCGLVSSGVPLGRTPLTVGLGIVLAGPLLCGTSQAINDWCDREVDAINEPDRPVPSGRLPGRSAFFLACLSMAAGLALATALGTVIAVLAVMGMILAVIYSAEPIRLKRNGWFGNASVGLSYEGLPWCAGAALLTGHMPGRIVIALALLYSIGAHGIMTLNDFKSMAGDRRLGLRSLPVQLGAHRACLLACAVMAIPQVLVAALLISLGRPWHAAGIACLLAIQVLLMRRLLVDPRSRAAWYNGTGTTLYVAGMMIAAFAVRP